MKLNKETDIETNYNRHIRQARNAARGYEGYERALKICDHFKGEGHPHPDYTFTQVRFNNSEGQSDRQFAVNLMKEMAYTHAVGDVLSSLDNSA